MSGPQYKWEVWLRGMSVSVQRECGVLSLLQPRESASPGNHHHPQRGSQVWDSRPQQVTSHQLQSALLGTCLSFSNMKLKDVSKVQNQYWTLWIRLNIESPPNNLEVANSRGSLLWNKYENTKHDQEECSEITLQCYELPADVKLNLVFLILFPKYVFKLKPLNFWQIQIRFYLFNKK